jgi:uridylate kinase
MAKNIIVISLGGSLIIRDKINIEFLKEFKKLILKHIGKNKFIIVVGGGSICRQYVKAAEEVENISNDDKDWIGIYASRLNAKLIKSIFKNKSHPGIVTDPTEKIYFTEDVLVAAGWKPGFSTDFDAVMLAKNFGIKTVINMTDVDYVYDKDPNKFEDAKPLKNITWERYRKIAGGKWKPAMKLPFDPIASKEAEKLSLKVVILNGLNLKNLDNFLNGEKFEGTVICD